MCNDLAKAMKALDGKKESGSESESDSESDSESESESERVRLSDSQ